jgi:hypothetical protein
MSELKKVKNEGGRHGGMGGMELWNSETLEA